MTATTAARFKDFGDGVETSAEPIKFKIKGEEFTAIPEVPGQVLLDFAALTQSEDGVKAAIALSEFFKTVLIEDDHERFDKLTHSGEKIINIQTLNAIFEWLVGEYTDRPEDEPGN